jgi:hypothetical protein
MNSTEAEIAGMFADISKSLVMPSHKGRRFIAPVKKISYENGRVKEEET